MFERFYVTSKGKTLEARTHSGGTISFTRMAFGDGTLAEGQSIEALTDLISRLKYIPISGASGSDNKAVISGAFSNSGIETSFYFREIGLYATDPVDGEVLYAYANAGANADSIPAFSTAQVDFTFALDITFSNTSNVTVVADTSLAFATQQELSAGLDGKVDTDGSNLTSVSPEDPEDVSLLAKVDGETEIKLLDLGDAVEQALAARIGDPIPLSHGGFGGTNASQARANIGAYALIVNCGTMSSLPKTVSNAAITSDMVVVESVVGTPSAMGSDWTVTTANGSLTISGTISGSSTLVLTLMHG